MVIPLSTRGRTAYFDETIVGTVIVCGEEGGSLVNSPRELQVACEQQGEILAIVTTAAAPSSSVPIVFGVPSLSHLCDGDVVALHTNGRIDTLFRAGSPNNSLFVTDRCNSNCLMCSQPPKNIDDIDFHHNLNTKLIPLIPKDTEDLGITGGEPTLLGYRLLNLFRMLGMHLPDTRVHVLSNGRAFAWHKVAKAVAGSISSPTIFGVPLYSDYPNHHDYVVQAPGAFHQTLLGLHNLARYSVDVEIRVVLHKQTFERLPSLARFIHKNLPFVEHIAMMGLEYTGYTPFNAAILWMEPEEYMAQLREASLYLETFGFNVSIYNLPLCLLPEELWHFSRASISQWKREYLEECEACMVKEKCGGIFGTSKVQSTQIRAIRNA